MGLQAPTFGSFGEHPADFARTEFFAFFYLVPEDSTAPAPKGDAVRLRPDGQFRAAVAVDVTAAPDGRTSALELSVAGSFIDEPATAPFGRDIVKSFIGGALASNDDVQTLRDVVDDLEYRPVSGATRPTLGGGDLLTEVKAKLDRGESAVVRMGGAPQTRALPEIASRGFAVYEGDRDGFRRSLTYTDFAMSNALSASDRTLTVSFVRRNTG